MPSEKDDLIYRYLRGDASEQDMTEMRSYLESNPTAMRDIYAAAETERDLYEVFGGQKATTAADPVSAARKRSSRRPAVRRIQRLDTLKTQQHLPLMIAASAAVCVLLLIAFGRSSSKQNIVKRDPAAPETSVAKPPEVARKNSDDMRRATQLELAALETRRTQMQERLAQIERERQKLAENKPQEASAEEVERRANIERINAERLKVEAELAEMRTTHAKLKESLANETVVMKTPQPSTQPKPETTAVTSKELGQIAFVSATLPPAVVVRAGTKLPAQRGMAVLPGDRIESGKADGRKTELLPEARVAVELFNGAIVDIAEQSVVELTSSETIRVERGQIYADVDLKTRQKLNGNQTALYQVFFTTPVANVLIEGTRFDLYAENNFTRLRMEEGRTTISNRQGSQKVAAFEETAVRTGTAPGKPYAITPNQIWRGRLNPAETAVLSFSLINCETNQPIAEFDPLKNGTELNLAKLPTRKLSVRANTIPEMVGSVRFGLNEKTSYNLEQVHPYSLNDDNDVNYRPWTPAPGTYKITATPSLSRDGKSDIGIPATITITVIDRP